MHLDQPYLIDGAGRTATTKDIRVHVRNLVRAVLFTAPGERVMRPEFGAGVREMLFEANSEAMATAAEFLVRTSIQRFLSEHVAVESLEVTRDEGQLTIELTYVLRGDDERLSDSFTREI